MLGRQLQQLGVKATLIGCRDIGTETGWPSRSMSRTASAPAAPRSRR
ncbi:hypothetical protein [Paracoccus mutanolyticus]|nr:hypothetical protein [Paracoccus mutanolyticus]